MKVTFWGVRGSLPSPLSPSEMRDRQKELLAAIRQGGIPTARNEDRFLDDVSESAVLVGGNTSCVEVSCGDDRLIFDAGSGIRLLGCRLMENAFGQGEGLARIFLSHTHWDHIQGLPFFDPLYVHGNRIEIYSGFTNISDRLEQQQRREYFPIPLHDLKADISFHTIVPEIPLDFADISDQTHHLRVIVHELQHPGGAFGYRVECETGCVVYATDSDFTSNDIEDIKDNLDFFKDADVLIFDSHFSFKESIFRSEWGHASAALGTRLAALAKVKKLVLFHHSPEYTDRMLKELLHEAQMHKSGPFPHQIILAREGLVLNSF
ncbi:MBL fold metallo-hydrolase [candidate division LCP-89 bacterium B3_LCP]|uniref:MBL fold metallo-hydrolase n=1 Tax=candidate division LCP-89 bacterium B3_LCP TaxID=2012998 RepID=A0A532V5E0_UNCL8|nr:MAG: MBL fold metallo-hydrolase [candidate division LCP-89 bacterium B3_LCP]